MQSQMQPKLPTVPVSRAGRSENRPPTNDVRVSGTRIRREEPSHSKPSGPRYTRSLPINCTLSVEDMIKEAFNNLIYEYLLKMNFPGTLEAFKTELTTSRPVSIDNYREGIVAAFRSGNRERFCEMWERFVPASLRMHDKETAKTEFFLALHFILAKAGPDVRDKTARAGPYVGGLNGAVEEFRSFLLKNGEEFSKIDDLLPYYALPFLKDPFGHPLFKELLTEGWTTALGEKLDALLGSLYSPKSKPYLLQLYESTVKLGDSNVHPQEAVGNSFRNMEDSAKQRTFHSFKDKSKAPLLGVLASRQVTEEAEVPVRLPSATDQEISETKKKPDSPSKAIQVKQYIAKLEAEKKKMAENTDLLAEQLHQTETKMAEMIRRWERTLEEKEQGWRQGMLGLMELSESLLAVAVSVREGREALVDAACSRMDDFRHQLGLPAPEPSQLQPPTLSEPKVSASHLDDLKERFMNFLEGCLNSQTPETGCVEA